MRFMSLLIPLAALAAVSATGAEQVGKVIPSTTNPEIWSKSKTEVLMKAIPSDISGAANDALTSRICPDYGHYSVTADFNGDGLEDHAAMLTGIADSSAPAPATRLVILPGTDGPPSEPVELTTLGPESGPRGWYLAVINGPKLYNFETNTWVNLTAPALGLIRCGGGANYWFWNGKVYEYAGGA